MKTLTVLVSLALAGGVPALALADDQPAVASPAPATTPAADAVAVPAAASTLDVPKLFATTCGWCHSGGGRVAGKGPQLMDTKRSDDFIRNRIKNGKQGGMPAFNVMFKDADIDRIIAYIRALKPEE